jgi:hypothetical protein
MCSRESGTAEAMSASGEFISESASEVRGELSEVGQQRGQGRET